MRMLPDDPSVLRCCADNPTVVAFRVHVRDGLVIVLACAEHELKTGLLLTEMGMNSGG